MCPALAGSKMGAGEPQQGFDSSSGWEAHTLPLSPGHPVDSSQPRVRCQASRYPVAVDCSWTLPPTPPNSTRPTSFIATYRSDSLEGFMGTKTGLTPRIRVAEHLSRTWNTQNSRAAPTLRNILPRIHIVSHVWRVKFPRSPIWKI